MDQDQTFTNGRYELPPHASGVQRTDIPASRERTVNGGDAFRLGALFAGTIVMLGAALKHPR